MPTAVLLHCQLQCYCTILSLGALVILLIFSLALLGGVGVAAAAGGAMCGGGVGASLCVDVPPVCAARRASGEEWGHVCVVDVGYLFGLGARLFSLVPSRILTRSMRSASRSASGEVGGGGGAFAG